MTAQTHNPAKKSSRSRARPSLDDLASGIRARDTAMLARAITLVESRNPSHKLDAQKLLLELLPDTAKDPSRAHRIGITGVPGVGKSTFIEAFGTTLCDLGKRVAVLAVDPTSSRTGGSILGDKTRMEKLGANPDAYIRPSPAGGTLGGVTAMTRETMLLCEAAGYDVILVETVGVGQSETVVADMVDFFLVLMLPGAGDELQGIKKGILEIADMICVNKADGENGQRRALAAAREYGAALSIMTPASENWKPPVTTCSGLQNIGLDKVWELATAHRQTMAASGEFDARRKAQQIRWMYQMIEDRLVSRVHDDPAIAARMKALEAEITSGQTTPVLAVEEIMGLVS
jgi:LAO/AO transport system kinase